MNILYTLKYKERLEEYGGTVYQYTHRKSGATVVCLHNDDPENLFAFCFPTPPPNSTGLPHILEHTVLCGSKHYPLKDPFLQLLKGSVYSFLNAMTFPDRTIYPAASALDKDLFNVLRVYGDAVYKPLLKKEMFAQEGHRLFFDEQGELTISGVVYNEMIGASSTHEHVISEWSLRGLLPDTIYRHSSGGDPEEIPSLSYKQFTEYYHKYYQPSHSLIFVCGNIPPQKYLRAINRLLRDRHAHSPPTERIDAQHRWRKPRTLIKTFPHGHANTKKQGSVTLNWLLPEVTNSYDILCAELVSELLLGHSGAPLYKTLIDSSLGEDLSPISGMETELHTLYFSAGLRGTNDADSAKIETLILKTLQKIVKQGFRSEQIDGALYKLEFSMREIKSLQGMRLLRRMLPGWLYRNDPTATLSVERALATIRVRMSQNTHLFEEYIQRHLVDNKHRLTLIAKPDPALAAKKNAALKRSLHAMQKNMTTSEQDIITKEQQKLQKLQSHQEDEAMLARIPRLTSRHMPKQARLIKTEHSHIDSTHYIIIRRHTNTVRYTTQAFNAHLLSNHELSYLPLFGTILTEIGTERCAAELLSERINRLFGSLYCASSLAPPINNPQKIERHFLVHTRTLQRTAQEAWALLSEILAATDFGNTKRLRQLITEEINEFRASLIPNAHNHAAASALSAITPMGVLHESLFGISQLHNMRSLPAAHKVLSTLATISQKLFSAGAAYTAISSDDGDIDSLQSLAQEHNRYLREHVSASDAPIPADKLVTQARSAVQSYSIPAGGNYVALAIKATPFSAETIHEYAGELLLSHILTTGPLWEEIRMKGGAYGASARYASAQGAFCFTSYRDPHVGRTLNRFMRILRTAPSNAVSDESVERAKVAISGKESRPFAPAEELGVALNRTICGYSNALRQKLHNAILRATRSTVSAAANRLSAELEDRSIAVIGEEKDIQSAGNEFPRLNANLIPLDI